MPGGAILASLEFVSTAIAAERVRKSALCCMGQEFLRHNRLLLEKKSELAKSIWSPYLL
jgi:hypothetical protein